MNNLSGFLQRFRKILNDKTEEEEVVREALKELLSIDLPVRGISVRNGTARLTLSPIERTEVFLRKSEVLKILKERGSLITDLH